MEVENPRRKENEEEHALPLSYLMTIFFHLSEKIMLTRQIWCLTRSYKQLFYSKNHGIHSIYQNGVKKSPL